MARNPSDSQPFGGQLQAGVPLITHAPESVDDILIIELVDTHSPSYKRIDYGTPFPGINDPTSGTVLYGDFVLVDDEPVNSQYVKRSYQKLPGSWLYDYKVNQHTGDIWPARKRKNVGASIQPVADIGAFGAPLVAYWPLDSSGNDAVNSNNLSGSVTYASGKFGNAAVFSGYDYLSGTFNIPISNFSFGCWFRQSSNNTMQGIASMSNAGQILTLGINASNLPFVELFIGGVSHTATGTVPITLATVYHIAFTVSVSDLVLYVNGVQVASVGYTGTISRATYFALGTSLDSLAHSVFKFTGWIDEALFFQEALSAGQIATVAAATAAAVFEIDAVEREDINSYVAWEVDLTIPQSQFNSLATAMVYASPEPYQHPARLNIPLFDLYGYPIGYLAPKADSTNIIVSEYFVIGKTAPSISFVSFFPDTLLLTSSYAGGSPQIFNNVLHDATMREYNGVFISLPATTPSYSQYVGSFVPASMLFTNGSAAVVGTSSKFTTDFTVGAQIAGPGNVIYNVLSITDDTHLTLTANFTGTTGSVDYFSQQGGGMVGTYIVICQGSGVEPIQYGLLWRVKVAKVIAV